MEEQGNGVKRDWRMGQPDTASAVVVWGLVVLLAFAMFAYPWLVVLSARVEGVSDPERGWLMVQLAVAGPLYVGAALRGLVGMLSPWSSWVWDAETIRRIQSGPHVRGRFSGAVRACTPQRGVLLFEETGIRFITREYVVWRSVLLLAVFWVAAGLMAALCGVYALGRRKVERSIEYRDVRAVDSESLQAAIEFLSGDGVEVLRFRPRYGDRPRLREQAELHVPDALGRTLTGLKPRHGDRPRVKPRKLRAAGQADFDAASRSLEDSREIQAGARRD